MQAQSSSQIAEELRLCGESLPYEHKIPEVTWNLNQPQVVRQGFTGVFPEFRGKRLGRWLKSAMLERILQHRPEVRFVRTENADSNTAMLGINQALGFRPYTSQIVWQVETERVLAYLNE